jgi:hypothetical protein
LRLVCFFKHRALLCNTHQPGFGYVEVQ